MNEAEVAARIREVLGLPDALPDEVVLRETKGSLTRGQAEFYVAGRQLGRDILASLPEWLKRRMP